MCRAWPYATIISEVAASDCYYDDDVLRTFPGPAYRFCKVEHLDGIFRYTINKRTILDFPFNAVVVSQRPERHDQYLSKPIVYHDPVIFDPHEPRTEDYRPTVVALPKLGQPYPTIYINDCLLVRITKPLVRLARYLPGCTKDHLYIGPIPMDRTVSVEITYEQPCMRQLLVRVGLAAADVCANKARAEGKIWPDME